MEPLILQPIRFFSQNFQTEIFVRSWVFLGNEAINKAKIFKPQQQFFANNV